MSLGVDIISFCVTELLSVSVSELEDGVCQKNINSITATTKKHKDKRVTKFDFFIFFTSQNLKYKNGSSKPRYIQYTLAQKITDNSRHITTRLLIRFKIRNGNLVENNIPAIKNG